MDIMNMIEVNAVKQEFRSFVLAVNRVRQMQKSEDKSASLVYDLAVLERLLDEQITHLLVEDLREDKTMLSYKDFESVLHSFRTPQKFIIRDGKVALKKKGAL